MQHDDLAFVRHMLDLANEISALSAGLTRVEFDQSPAIRLALTHLLQNIGEAARKTSERFRLEHDSLPWTLIIGMRHKIVHDYMDVDFDVVWQTVVEDIPPLIASLTPIVERG